MTSTVPTSHASARHLLGAELRHWRQARGLSTSQLAALVYVSRELVQKVETARRNASADLVADCDRVLDTGGVLGRLLAFVAHQEREAAQTASVVQLPASPASTNPDPPVKILVTMTAEVVPAAGLDADVDGQAAIAGEAANARIYRFPARRGGGRR